MNDSDAFRVDLHVKVLDDSVVERARRAGLDAVVYAPHFTRLPEIRERAAAHSSDDLLVIPGREVFTGPWDDRKHVLALDLAEPVPDFITLEAAIAEFERQDAVVLAPHPEFATVGLAAADLREHRDVVDAVEIFNPKHLPTHNRRARRIADSLAAAPFTSSYAHLPGSVGAAYTEFDGDTVSAATPERDLLAALRNGAARRIVHRNGLRRVRTTAGELAHLCYENSWKKVDRVLLSGRESTHPRHVAYDGRFDDAAVY